MLILVLLSVVSSSLAGTPCPDRASIYPCSCMSIPQTKKVSFTSVTCHRLPDTDALTSIFPALRAMSIDHLYLYDSFWQAHKLEGGENKQALPADWITLLKVKEIEIVDTTLSSCFACESSTSCRNAVTTRFSAINSSSHDQICGLCKSVSGGRFSWTSCLSKLRQFHFRYGKLTSVSKELFPAPMRELTEVDLSYNQISKIEAGAFSKMPRIKVLILSHNALERLDAMFDDTKLPALEKLDVSWNLLKTLGNPSFFPQIPSLKNLIANNNFILNLNEDEWKGIGDSIRLIDLQDNPLHCDCDIRWVNSTFAVGVQISGVCATPDEYENSAIRKASRMLIERCDKDGSIGTRPNTKGLKAVTPVLPTEEKSRLVHS